METKTKGVRWLLIVLALALAAVTVAACGEDEEPVRTQTQTQTQTQTVEEPEDVTLADILAGDDELVGEEVEISAEVAQVLAGPGAFTIVDEDDETDQTGGTPAEDDQVLVLPREDTEIDGPLGAGGAVRIRGTVIRVEDAETFADDDDYLFETGDTAFLAEFEGDLAIVADEVEVLGGGQAQQEAGPAGTPQATRTPEGTETPHGELTPEGTPTSVATGTPTP